MLLQFCPDHAKPPDYLGISCTNVLLSGNVVEKDPAFFARHHSLGTQNGAEFPGIQLLQNGRELLGGIGAGGLLAPTGKDLLGMVMLVVIVMMVFMMLMMFMRVTSAIAVMVMMMLVLMTMAVVIVVVIVIMAPAGTIVIVMMLVLVTSAIVFVMVFVMLVTMARGIVTFTVVMVMMLSLFLHELAQLVLPCLPLFDGGEDVFAVKTLPRGRYKNGLIVDRTHKTHAFLELVLANSIGTR